MINNSLATTTTSFSPPDHTKNDNFKKQKESMFGESTSLPEIVDNDYASTSATYHDVSIFEKDLKALEIGEIVQCITKAEQFLTGELLQFDEKSGIILLRDQKQGNNKSSLHFVNAFSLKSFKKLSPSTRNYRPPILPFDSRGARERVARAEYRMNKLWVDDSLVNEQGMKMYIELKRIFDDVIWEGTNILILKCVRLSHPYDESAVESTDAKTSSINALVRIKKIVGRQSSRDPTANTFPLSENLANSITEQLISVAEET